MIIGLEFLKEINEKVISICGGKQIEFASGEEMQDYYARANGKYAVSRIQIDDGLIVVSVEDKSGNYCE